MVEKRAPKHLRDALDTLLGAMAAPSKNLLDVVFQEWPEVVGVDVARYCRPVKIEGDRLVVEAADPAWASELKWLSPQIVERVQQRAKTDQITSVTVRVERHK